MAQNRLYICPLFGRVHLQFCDRRFSWGESTFNFVIDVFRLTEGTWDCSVNLLIIDDVLMMTDSSQVVRCEENK